MLRFTLPISLVSCACSPENRVVSCGYIRGEGRFQTTSPPPSLRYHIFRLPVSTRQLPFASILLAYTRHGLSLSRGYCLSSNGRRMRAWPLSRVQVRAYTGIESSNEFGIRYVYVYLYIYIYTYVCIYRGEYFIRRESGRVSRNISPRTRLAPTSSNPPLRV